MYDTTHEAKNKSFTVDKHAQANDDAITISFGCESA